MKEEVRCSTCGATLFWNQACDQYQHEEEWRNRDHFPTCDYNNSGASMAVARLRSMGRA